MKRRWYEFRAQARGAAEIVIYDEIGAFGIPAKAFIDELKALGAVADLTVRINSPGGSVFDGVRWRPPRSLCPGCRPWRPRLHRPRRPRRSPPRRSPPPR
jgi:hypothetical protein